MRAATLREFRGAFVQRQYIRVAVFFQRIVLCGVERIEPRAGRQHRHALPHADVNFYAGQTCPTIIEHAYHVAGFDATRRRVLRIQRDRFASLNFGGDTDTAVIVLTVQASDRLLGYSLI